MASTLTLGQQIRRARRRRRLTQEQLANAAGLTRAYIARLEADRGAPSLPALERIAHVFGRRVSISLVKPTEED